MQSLLWFSAIGCGLMAGVYFAFSVFVMQSLARLPPEMGIATMNAFNTEIVRSAFIPLFSGTSIAAALLAGFAIARWSEAGSILMLFGALIYVGGMFVVTVTHHVPLNDALAGTAGPEAVQFWSRYLISWTIGNHVRTIASLMGSVIFTAVLVMSGSRAT